LAHVEQIAQRGLQLVAGGAPRVVIFGGQILLNTLADLAVQLSFVLRAGIFGVESGVAGGRIGLGRSDALPHGDDRRAGGHTKR
jgi:hypothetical protein